MKTFHWNRRISAINEQRAPKVEEEENSRLLREWMKPDAGDFTLGEFTEKMILLGCIMVSFIYLLIYSFIFIILFVILFLFVYLSASIYLWGDLKLSEDNKIPKLKNHADLRPVVSACTASSARDWPYRYPYRCASFSVV